MQLGPDRLLWACFRMPCVEFIFLGRIVQAGQLVLLSWSYYLLAMSAGFGRTERSYPRQPAEPTKLSAMPDRLVLSLITDDEEAREVGPAVFKTATQPGSCVRRW